MALSGANIARPSFTAPHQPPTGRETLRFSLTVTDQFGAASTDRVDVIVQDIYAAPVANAGPNQTVNELSTVALDGTGNYDRDPEISLTYSWTQLLGTSVALANANTAQPTFTAPPQPPGSEQTLRFSLTVDDGYGGTRTHSVDVTVMSLPTPTPTSTPTPTPTPTSNSSTAQVQQPINPDGSSVFNVHRGVVPARFTLTLNGVATCNLPSATIAVTRTAGGTIGPVGESVYSGPADNGSSFRIDSCQ